MGGRGFDGGVRWRTKCGGCPDTVEMDLKSALLSQVVSREWEEDDVGLLIWSRARALVPKLACRIKTLVAQSRIAVQIDWSALKAHLSSYFNFWLTMREIKQLDRIHDVNVLSTYQDVQR